MNLEAEQTAGAPAMSVSLGSDDVVRLSWAPGVTVTGSLARQAVAAVDAACQGRHRPLLVDMTQARPLTREARAVFAQRCDASRIALLGKSAVDRVIANFVLGVSGPPVPTRFFTDEAEAAAWLRGGGDE